MRFLVSLLGLAALLSGCSEGAEKSSSAEAAAPAPVLARYHFVGATAMSADTNAAKLTTIGAMPSTRAFLEATLAKLARTPHALAHDPLAANAPNHVTELRPLLDDLLSAESCGEWRGVSNRPAETLFAIKLSNERAAAWSATLAQVATDWSGSKTNALPGAGLAGWQLKKKAAPNLIQLARVGGWVVVGAGQDRLAMFDGAVERAAKQQIPVAAGGGGWLTAFVDLAKLAERSAWTSPVPLGELKVTASGRDENVRLEGSIKYPRPLDLRLEAWQVPTPYITDPLISFSVARGFGAWLSEQRWVRDLGLGDAPNQITLWAQSQAPFQTFWAVPMRDTTNRLAALEPRLNALVSSNFPVQRAGVFRYTGTNGGLSWERVPYIAPFAQRIDEARNEFMLGGFFPRANVTNPAPQALYDSFMSKSNVVYYGWEITQERLTTLRGFTQLACVISGRWQAKENDPGWKWIPEVAPLLGNTVTEVTLKSPTELAFTRRGHAGLTALEITLLVRVLDAEGFPLHSWEWLKPDPKAFVVPQRPQTQLKQ